MNTFAHVSVLALALCCGCQSARPTVIGGWGPEAVVSLPGGNEGQLKVRWVRDAGAFFLEVRNVGLTSFKMRNRLCVDTDMAVHAYDYRGDMVPLCEFDICKVTATHTKMLAVPPNGTCRVEIVSVFDAPGVGESVLFGLTDPSAVRYQRVVLYFGERFRGIESGLIKTHLPLLAPLDSADDSAAGHLTSGEN